MKIFTNTQTSHVAGISRVMSSFASHVRSLRAQRVELVSVSLAKTPGGAQEWRTERGPGCSALHEYQAPLLQFGEVIRAARTLDDVRRAYAPLTEALRQKLKEERPDVVLVNGTYFMPWCLMMAARSLRIPVVLYYHGSLTKETAHWDDPRARRLLTRLEASFDRADVKHIFPSALIKEFVEREVFLRPLPRRSAVVLPNPVPEAFFRARGRKTKPRIAFVGRWARVKNPAFLVRLVALNRRAGSPFEIWVLTDPESRKHAAKILHDRVHFARPRSKSADLASFYRRMSAVICPSHFETYGNVAQEAVAAGTPAFVSRNMGVAEILRKVGLDELIVDFNNPREVFKLLQAAADTQVDRTARRALRRIAGAPVVHTKLLEYLRA
jgi:glycosyltransferase involved in cell wall biosynthesis